MKCKKWLINAQIELNRGINNSSIHTLPGNDNYKRRVLITHQNTTTVSLRIKDVGPLVSISKGASIKVYL